MAFFCLCVVPTAVIAVWGMVWRHPTHLQAASERLGRELGLQVAMDGVKHLRPGVIAYEGLRLSDPETGQSILRCHTLEATWTKMIDSQGDQRPAIALTASQVEVETAGWNRLYQILQRRLQADGGRPETEIRLAADNLTLCDGDTSSTLVNLEGGVGALPGGIQAQAVFHLAGSKSSTPIRMRIVRNRQLTPPANGFELHTGDNELPCQVLAIGLTELKTLGSACRFSGYAWANPSSTGWEGELTGQLFDINLGNLVADPFSHRLSGMANVTIQRAQFHHGRLEEAVGSIAAGPGVIGRGLLDAAITHLKFAHPSEQIVSGDQLPFDRLAMNFAIDAHGVQIQGRCPKASVGTILTMPQGYTLGDPASQPQPISALIRTLAPSNTLQVPVARQTDWLTQHLPIPEISAAPPTQVSRPQVQFRSETAVER
jgi:hypothetical protein